MLIGRLAYADKTQQLRTRVESYNFGGDETHYTKYDFYYLVTPVHNFRSSLVKLAWKYR